MIKYPSKPVLRLLAVALTIVLFCALGYRLLLLSEDALTTRRGHAAVVGWDSSIYLCMAFNLYHNRVISVDGHPRGKVTSPQSGTTSPAPTAFVAPLLPALISLVFFFDEDLRSASFDELIIWFPGMSTYDGLIPTAEALSAVQVDSTGRTARDSAGLRWQLLAGVSGKSPESRSQLLRLIKK